MTTVSVSQKDKNKLSNGLSLLLILTLIITVLTLIRDHSSDEVDILNDSTESKSTDRVNLTTLRSGSNSRITDREGQLEAVLPDFINWDYLKRSNDVNIKNNPFTSHSWVVVNEEKKAVITQPTPTAPSAPFVFLGSFEDDINVLQIFLLANNQLYAVGLGQRINTDWRLDSVDVNSIKLTYLPLNLSQRISKSSRSVESNQLIAEDIQ